MAEIRIPEDHRKTLITLASLTDDQADELARAVTNLPAKRRRSKNPESLGVKKIDPEHERQIFDTLLSLYLVRAYYETPVEAFIQDLMTSLTRVEQMTSGEQERLRLILGRVLSVQPVIHSTKAELLEREHQYIFHDAKIFTDLRPVFESPTDPPAGVVVAHIMKIIYHTCAGAHDERYLALDADDLVKIKAVIERAEAKAASLKTLLREKQIPEL